MVGKKVYDEPSDIEAEHGNVKIDGPDAVHVKLTPEAAVETSDRILEGAMKARGQQLRKGPRELLRSGK